MGMAVPVSSFADADAPAAEADAGIQTDSGKAADAEPPAKPPEPRGPTCKYFRSGLLLGAEVGEGKTLKVTFNKLDSDNLKDLDKKWKAVLFFRPDPGRAISIYDYILKTKQGMSHPCVAFKGMDEDGYDGEFKWETKDLDPKKIYSMLFLVNPPTNKDDDVVEYFLLCDMDKKSGSLSPLRFKNVKDGAFTPAAGIPDTGDLDLPDEHKVAEPVKAAAAKAAAAEPAPEKPDEKKPAAKEATKKDDEKKPATKEAPKKDEEKKPAGKEAPQKDEKKK